MAELSPILPFIYNAKLVGDVSSVITPPYDVISAEECAIYRARHPYSAIHIELPSARSNSNPYEEAAKLVQEWVASGVLQPFPEPAMFVHQQTFTCHGKNYTRTALVAGVRLEPWEAGVVIPHERTFAGPKKDRLELLRATHVAPSSIFGLYEQKPPVAEVIASVVSAGEPLIVAFEPDVEHKVWAITDAKQLATIHSAMRDSRIYIADGHHRYETALAYRDERRLQDGNYDNAAYNYVAMSLVAFDDPGLVVLPTHRLIRNLAPTLVDELPARAGKFFSVDNLELISTSEGAVQQILRNDWDYAFLIYGRRGAWLFTADHEVAAYLPEDRSEAWKKLDLAVLHELVFRKLLDMDLGNIEEYVQYTRSIEYAVAAVNDGDFQLAAFVRPTGVDQLRAVADAGDRMPHKSTYFYPKFPAGLIINRLDVRLPRIAEVMR